MQDSLTGHTMVKTIDFSLLDLIVLLGTYQCDVVRVCLRDKVAYFSNLMKLCLVLRSKPLTGVKSLLP